MTLPPRSEWDRAPWNRWSFQHVADIVPTSSITRGSELPRPLPRREVDLGALPVEGLAGADVTLAAFLESTFTDGFLVLKDGAVAYERYLNGMAEHTLHLSQSVAKSFVGALAGILIERGVLEPNTPVTAILPELRSTAYAGALVRHLLDMTSGVRFTEDYDDPYSDMGRADVASGWKSAPAYARDSVVFPAAMWELVLTLRDLDGPHGTRFSYRSIETDVLAFILERTTGRRLAQLLSEEIWQPLRMEQDGRITIDSAGFATADGGLNATLRDYGRFGQAILDDGAGVIPAGWIEATRAGNHGLFGTPYTSVLPRGAYRNQFWVEDPEARNLMARGVFGQLIYIDWTHRTVVVKLSSWPHFVDSHWTATTLAVARRVGAALS